MRPIALSARGHSGVRQVQTLYGRDAFVALAAAIDFHLLAVAVYFLSALLSGRGLTVEVPGVRPIFIDSHPRIPRSGGVRPQGPVVPTPKEGQRRIAAITIPVPVMLDDSAFAVDPRKPNSGIAGMFDAADVSGGSTFGRDQGVSDGPLTSDTDPVDPVVSFAEKPPVPFKIVKPDYPDQARRMGLEGVVWVKALVEKDGRVSKATVTKSTNDMFNDRSVEAALRWVFVPGMMNSGAVRVWTAIPFRFSLVK